MPNTDASQVAESQNITPVLQSNDVKFHITLTKSGEFGCITKIRKINIEENRNTSGT
jgi:hypothetical protein